MHSYQLEEMGIDSVKELKLAKKTSTVIEEICSKIKLPSVEIRGIMEITNNKSDGVEIIKKAFVRCNEKKYYCRYYIFRSTKI